MKLFLSATLAIMLGSILGQTQLIQTSLGAIPASGQITLNGGSYPLNGIDSSSALQSLMNTVNQGGSGSVSVNINQQPANVVSHSIVGGTGTISIPSNIFGGTVGGSISGSNIISGSGSISGSATIPISTGSSQVFTGSTTIPISTGSSQVISGSATVPISTGSSTTTTSSGSKKWSITINNSAVANKKPTVTSTTTTSSTSTSSIPTATTTTTTTTGGTGSIALNGMNIITGTSTLPKHILDLLNSVSSNSAPAVVINTTPPKEQHISIGPTTGGSVVINPFLPQEQQISGGTSGTIVLNGGPSQEHQITGGTTGTIVLNGGPSQEHQITATVDGLLETMETLLKKLNTMQWWMDP
uniref:Uncharacterized protein n=1 Tax=Stomoxys calcitrans TaxID=35570 RepID=A0A1I8QBE0_STOCA